MKPEIAGSVMAAICRMKTLLPLVPAKIYPSFSIKELIFKFASPVLKDAQLEPLSGEINKPCVSVPANNRDDPEVKERTDVFEMLEEARLQLVPLFVDTKTEPFTPA